MASVDRDCHQQNVGLCHDYIIELLVSDDHPSIPIMILGCWIDRDQQIEISLAQHAFALFRLRLFGERC